MNLYAHSGGRNGRSSPGVLRSCSMIVLPIVPESFPAGRYVSPNSLGSSLPRRNLAPDIRSTPSPVQSAKIFPDTSYLVVAVEFHAETEAILSPFIFTPSTDVLSSSLMFVSRRTAGGGIIMSSAQT